MEINGKANSLAAVLFDLDNTLIATRTADEVTCEKVLYLLIQKYYMPREAATRACAKFLKSFRNCPDNDVHSLETWRKHLWTESLGESYAYLTGPIYDQWLHLRYQHLAMPQEVKTLLKSIREDYLVGLITNGPSAAQWEKVDKLNLRPLFDVILVSGDLPWEKPQKGIFQEACDMLGVEPSQTIMIGDKLETDILGGINARVGATIWIPPANRTLKIGDPTPDMIITNVTELNALIPHIKNMIKERIGSNRRVFERMSLDAEDCNSNGSDGS